MDWKLDKSRPICPQLCELICVAVANGTIVAGEKLLSVREIALAAGVNPNTVQKSFEELERRGVIHSVRGSGWYVNENTNAAAVEVNSLRMQRTRDYLAAMAQLGCDPEQINQYLKECQGGTL
ncbi:MAG: GntR family transcriptional regulator [Ruminococcaceae bacterium]|nr:GntR family transcriptional regulator [Oscillospiraceae bacterium]